MKTRKERLFELHWPLIGVLLVIAALGVYNLHSAAAAKHPTLYVTQFSWLCVGSAFVFCLMLVDYRISETLAYLIYGVVCLALVAVLVVGTKAGGAQRWLAFGGFRFQPSELAKIATILCLARYFGSRVEDERYSLFRLFRPLNPSRFVIVAVFVIVNWGQPWMVDPVGSLARFVYPKLGETVLEVGEPMWFRVLCLCSIGLSCALVIWAIGRFSEARALLNPWPQNRRRNLIGLALASALAGVLLIAWFWEQPWLRDPIATSINYLRKTGGPGGVYETVQEGYLLPSLLVGLLIVYALASFQQFRLWRGPLVDQLIAPFDLLALPALLILVEPDLGTAGIVLLIGMSMIFVVGIQLRSLIFLGGIGTIVAIIGWFGVLKDYQKRRILTFIDPEHDIHGAGWNAIQSIIAVGSGRWFGKGHQEGTQTQFSFLPEQHTDFAFSVWGEEMGFVGCVILLGLYLVAFLMAFAIAADARETYGSLLAVGVAALLMWQTIINVGMVIGVAPVVGMTLPLFSYGGSSIVTTMIGLGLLINVHFRRRTPVV